MADPDTKDPETAESEGEEFPAPTGSTALVPAPAEGEPGVAATQMGERRFVYAAYFAGAIAVGFVMSKLLHNVWLRLATFKPAIGEPRDDVLIGLSGLIGLGTAYYYWKRTRARQLAEEVAQELAKVTWPTKQEVTSSTTVVLVTTAVSTIFFALMDRFWGFITNFVYGI